MNTCNSVYGALINHTSPNDVSGLPMAAAIPQAAVLRAALTHPSLYTNLPTNIITRVIEELIRLHPYFPPCRGALTTGLGAGWRCLNGKVSFVDTVVWRCPDGSSVIKEGASIVTKQGC